MSGNDTSQMCSTSRAGNDNLQSFLVRLFGKLGGLVRRTMRGKDMHFIADAKFFATLGGFFHHFEVRVTAHDDSDAGVHKTPFTFWGHATRLTHSVSRVP